MDTSSISGGGRKQPIIDKVGFDRRTFHRNSGCSLPPAFLTRVHGAGVGGGGREHVCMKHLVFWSCYGLKCIPQNSYAKTRPQVPRKVMLFGDRAFTG